MFIMITIALVSAVFLAVCLLALVCRHTPDMWIAADDTILCFVAPGLILVSTIGALSLGWRFTHGGLGSVSIGAWIGSAVIIAIYVGIWRMLAARIRKSGANRQAVANRQAAA